MRYLKCIIVSWWNNKTDRRKSGQQQHEVYLVSRDGTARRII